MASQPKKDAIAEALVAALQGIGKGAGYWTDMGRNISRRYWLTQEVNASKLPCASVLTTETADAPTQCVGSYRERVTYVVEIWTRSLKPEDVDRDTLRAEADVKKAIFSNAGVTALVHQVLPGKVQGSAQEFSDTLLGYKAVGFLVDYNWTAASP